MKRCQYCFNSANSGMYVAPKIFRLELHLLFRGRKNAISFGFGQVGIALTVSSRSNYSLSPRVNVISTFQHSVTQSQRTLVIGGSITVRLTSFLTGLNSTKQVQLMLIQHKQVLPPLLISLMATIVRFQSFTENRYWNDLIPRSSSPFKFPFYFCGKN